jgi:phosphoribosylaminoimidazolecarboxamide formyltransferase/IMP cyclohydrolase
MAAKLALVSVTDKTGIADFCRKLVALGFEILSTGGTSALLQKEGVPVTPVESYTNSPEVMDGRVKTLHPRVHGGLLARAEKDLGDLERIGARLIDVVCVNLYAFDKASSDPTSSYDHVIENIDIGGPSMLRSSAKNHARVTVVTEPGDYERVLTELANGGTSLRTRQELALKVYAKTAAYDAAIERWLAKQIHNEERLHLTFEQGEKLRYGENNHQAATYFREPATVQSGEASLGKFEQLHGKELSFNNIVDADAALEAARELVDAPAAVIIKHLNPCGFATGATLKDALVAAWAGDPVSAFGGVIALTRPVDVATAEFLKGRFVEIVIAPSFEPDALEFLKNKSKDIRLLAIGSFEAGKGRKVYKHVIGGMLVQDRDVAVWEKFESVTKVAFPEEKQGLAAFTWKACKHLKSNAIAVGFEYAPGQFSLVGGGMGQPNRIDSNQKLAQPRVMDWLKRERPSLSDAECKQAIGQMVLASDAFFPFPDNVIASAEFGVRMIVQPGGSVKDVDSIAKADELGVAMAFTGTRHFRH